jgi:hypothetical protein
MSENTRTSGSTRRHRRVRAFQLSATRRGAIGVGLAAIMAAGGLGAVQLLGAGQGTGRTVTGMHSATAAAQATVDALGIPPGGIPQAAAAPHVAVMPTDRASSARPSPTDTSQPAGQASSRQPVSSGTAAPTPASAPPPGPATCTKPQYTSSDPTAMWNQSPYFVADDMWNVSGYNVSQTLYACSHSDWYVVATMDNSKGDGAVKTFPNSHRDFDNNPEISSLSSITSTFAETSPDSGIYEDAYDIWLNGIASSGSTEVMIWTDNHGQTPSGSVQATVTIDGRSYAVWKTTGYIAFVASTNFTSGTLNLLGFFQWLMKQGWIPGNTTLGQVDYGPELVSTNGVPATFTFSNFSVDAS